MLLKQTDDKSLQVQALENLAVHPRLPADKRSLVERELVMLRAGIKGEREAAYDIDFYSGSHKSRIVLHDLRFEHNGRVAQIDHLVINRLLDAYVIETKHFSEGVSISDTGEFTAWYGGKPRGIPSPLEQNDRHIEVLRDVFGSLDMPTRVGIRLMPKFVPVVMVSKNARVSRPKKFDTSNVIKSDQFETWFRKNVEDGSPLQLAKLVSDETLLEIGNQLIRLHRPLKPDYLAKFGIDAKTLVAPREEAAKPLASEASTNVAAEPVEKKSKLICTECGAVVTYAVAKFCWFNKNRFGGNVYCMDCQKHFGADGQRERGSHGDS